MLLKEGLESCKDKKLEMNIQEMMLFIMNRKKIFRDQLGIY